MESFFRYIAYVDYYKNGDKVRNVGFLRWKLHKDIHYLEIQIKDVGNYRGQYDIQEKNTQKVIGEIVLDKGIGNFSKGYPSLSASGEKYIETRDNRLYLYDVEGLEIRLNENEYLSVDVKLPQEKEADKFTLNSERKSLFDENIESNKIEVVSKKESQFLHRNNEKDVEAASENVLIEGIEEKYQEQNIISDKLLYPQKVVEHQESYNVEKQKANYIDLPSKKIVKIIEPLHEDKWQQLCKDYPKVHPFPDKKTFLSVKPEDFIILQQEYQKLVNNSFLLHGFYNYGHMILGKLTEEEEAPVYIGVPGVYYEREKQAARMFGFVGFESTEQPVQSGSYGYYMIEVKI